MSTLFPHRMALGRAVRRLSQKPFGTLLSTLVIAIALALPVLGYVLVDNLAGIARGVSGKPEISLFFKLDTPREQAQAIETRLRSDKRVAALRFVTREEALTQLSARGGFADVTSALPENPLPDALILEPRDDAPAAFTALRDELAKLPEAALVQLDTQWVARMHQLIEVARGASLLLGLLFGTALVIVTFNTIRLQILTQRQEIAVSLMLGATREFVRRPFLYFGFLQGLLGGLLAWGMVAALMLLIAPRLQQLAASFSIVVDLAGPGPLHVIVLLAFAALLGWLGAALSVRRHLHDGPVVD